MLIVFTNNLYAQQGVSSWSVGVSGSLDYFFRSLVDANRFDIDTNLQIGLTDQQYIDLRNEHDKNYIGYSAGIFADFKIRPKLVFETGLQMVEGGVKVDVGSISNYPFFQIFGVQNAGSVVSNPYRILEVPILFKHRLGDPPKHDLGGRKSRNTLISIHRYFFFNYGIGIGMPINGDQFYNGVEHSNITSNMGVAGLVGLGFHMDTRSRFYFNIRAQGRATLLSYYEYAPIKSYYNSASVWVKLGYKLSAKEKSNNGKPTDCVSFTDNPIAKSRPKLMMAFRYGLNTNFMVGSSASDPLIGIQGAAQNVDPKIESATGDVKSTYTPHAGLHLEYLFTKYLSLGATPSYSQRGYKARHTYFLEDGRTLKTQQRVYLDYAELPIRISYYPNERFWVHFSFIPSFKMNDRLYNYYQVYDNQLNFPNENQNYRDKEDVQQYFGYPADPMVLGYEFGGGVHLDKNVAFSTQFGMYENMFTSDNGHATLRNLTLQFSMYYFFLHK